MLEFEGIFRNGNMKKHFLIIATFITVNLLIYFLLLPYAQKSANSHLYVGRFFGTILYIVSGFLAILGILKIRKKETKKFCILLAFATILIFGGYKLHSLMCLECLNCG